jgi:hypothetical protein
VGKGWNNNKKERRPFFLSWRSIPSFQLILAQPNPLLATQSRETNRGEKEEVIV